MASMKTTVAVVASGQRLPAKKSAAKPFDDFAERMSDLGETYQRLERSLKATKGHGVSTAAKMQSAVAALEFLENFDPSRLIKRCLDFLEHFEFESDGKGDDGGDDEEWNEEEYNEEYDAWYRSRVSLCVVPLLGAFPNANPADPKVFVSTLIDDMAGCDASLVVIEAAVRKVRRTMKFLPSIAEVLEAIRDEETAWAPGFDAVHGGIDLLRKALETRRGELQAELAAEAEQQRLVNEAEERNPVRFPIRSRVAAKDGNGIGVVEGYLREWITVNFYDGDGRKSWRHVKADDLYCGERAGILGSVCVGERVFHPSAGLGTVSVGASVLDDSQEAEVDFDTGGRRQVDFEELFVVEETVAAGVVERTG